MYYPKSQIKSNLYTNGGEFISTSTQQEYIGYYYQVSTGKFYTGKNPSDRPNIELTPLNPSTIYIGNTIILPIELANQTTVISSSDDYSLITHDAFNKKTIVPYYSPVIPTTQDYQNGEFQRYFCKKTNNIIYIEINLDQFTKLKAKDPQILYQLYQPFTITWVLTGNKEQVAKTNKNIVELASFRQKLPRFGDYLKFDYIKYYK